MRATTSNVLLSFSVRVDDDDDYNARARGAQSAHTCDRWQRAIARTALPLALSRILENA